MGLTWTLLDAGVDVYAADNSWEMTPLQVAAVRNHIELVQILLEAGADVDVPNGGEERTAIQAAAENNNKGSFKFRSKPRVPFEHGPRKKIN